MSGVADHSLIEISDLDVDSAFGVRERSQIADVTVPANPHRRPFGDHSTARCFKPLVKFKRVAADISVRRACHLQTTAFGENRLSLFKLRKTEFLRLHPRAPDRCCLFNSQDSMARGRPAQMTGQAAAVSGRPTTARPDELASPRPGGGLQARLRPLR